MGMPFLMLAMNKEVVCAAIEQNHFAIQFASIDLLNDAEFVEIARKNGWNLRDLGINMCPIYGKKSKHLKELG